MCTRVTVQNPPTYSIIFTGKDKQFRARTSIQRSKVSGNKGQLILAQIPPTVGVRLTPEIVVNDDPPGFNPGQPRALVDH